MFNKLIAAIVLFLSVGKLSATSSNPITAPDKRAPVYCAKSIIINARPQRIWEVLSNINDWNKWMPAVSKAKLNGSLAPGTTFDWKTGGMKIHSQLRTVNPYSEIGWTGKVYSIYGIHYWTFKAINDSVTEVFVSESMQGVLAGMFKKSLNKTLEKDMIQSLALLKKASES